MYTLFEQIICHRCVFASVSRTRVPCSAFVHRNVLARDAPARFASRTRAPRSATACPLSRFFCGGVLEIFH